MQEKNLPVQLLTAWKMLLVVVLESDLLDVGVWAESVVGYHLASKELGSHIGRRPLIDFSSEEKRKENFNVLQAAILE